MYISILTEYSENTFQGAQLVTKDILVGVTLFIVISQLVDVDDLGKTEMKLSFSFALSDLVDLPPSCLHVEWKVEH